MKNNDIINLTYREKEILKYLALGYSNPEIAKKLIISIHTVKAHIENIYRKLNVHNKVQTVIQAFRYKILSPDDF